VHLLLLHKQLPACCHSNSSTAEIKLVCWAIVVGVVRDDGKGQWVIY
jgi:hypothetical protein